MYYKPTDLLLSHILTVYIILCEFGPNEYSA